MSFEQMVSTRAHLRHGVKVGLASVLAYLVSTLLHMPYSFWAVITAVIVMQMHVADSIRMSVYRLTGTAMGAVIGVTAILVFPPTLPFTLLGLFLATGLCAYLTRYNERYRMAAITVAIVFLTSLGEQDRILYTGFRVLEIGIGVLCAFAVSVLLWPSRIGETLRQRLSTQYTEAAVRYEGLMDDFLSRQRKTDPDMFFELARDVRQNRELFHKVFALERRFFREDVRLLSVQVNGLDAVLNRLQGMPSVLNEVEGEGFDIIMAPELRELARATSEALRAVGAGAACDSKPLAAAVVAVEERLLKLRHEGVTTRFDLRRWLQVLGFINTAQHLGEYLLDVLNKPELPAGSPDSAA